MVRGLYVGRFQPVHLGHLRAIQHILSEVDELVIVVGSTQLSHELGNPFTAGERITMLRLALEEAGISPDRYWIVGVPDAEMHSVWVSKVVSYCPSFNVVYTNEPLTRRLFVEAGYEVRPVPYFQRHIYSATEVRRRILNDEDWQELVPRSVAEYIVEIGGVERLKDLARSDKPQA